MMQVLANFSYVVRPCSPPVRYPLCLAVVRAVNMSGPVQLRQLVIMMIQQVVMTLSTGTSIK